MNFQNGSEILGHVLFVLCCVVLLIFRLWFVVFQLIFYVVMFSENLLLLAAWLAGVWPNFSALVPLLVLFSFLMGTYFKIDRFFGMFCFWCPLPETPYAA